MVGLGAHPSRLHRFWRPDDDRRLAQIEIAVDDLLEIVAGAHVLRVPPGRDPGGFEVARQALGLVRRGPAVIADEDVGPFGPAGHVQTPHPMRGPSPFKRKSAIGETREAGKNHPKSLFWPRHAATVTIERASLAGRHR